MDSKAQKRTLLRLKKFRFESFCMIKSKWKTSFGIWRCSFYGVCSQWALPNDIRALQSDRPVSMLGFGREVPKVKTTCSNWEVFLESMLMQICREGSECCFRSHPANQKFAWWLASMLVNTWITKTVLSCKVPMNKTNSTTLHLHQYHQALCGRQTIRSE